VTNLACRTQTGHTVGEDAEGPSAGIATHALRVQAVLLVGPSRTGSGRDACYELLTLTTTILVRLCWAAEADSLSPSTRTSLQQPSTT
jgi:hypothetical protein